MKKNKEIWQKVRKWLFRTLLIIAGLHLSFMMLTSTLLVVYKWLNPPVTSIMLYRKIFYKWPLQKIRYLEEKKIPLRTRNMIIRVEDGAFYTHHGILLSAMKNAWELNKGYGKPVYGGSTITMQTARTIFLVPEKSYLRKYLEIIVALEMEVILGKDRIFELYLNYAEWGKGIFGIEAASRHYYGKTVSKLTTDEAIRLVTLLSSPIKYSPKTINKSPILRSRYLYLCERYAK